MVPRRRALLSFILWGWIGWVGPQVAGDGVNEEGGVCGQSSRPGDGYAAHPQC